MAKKPGNSCLALILIKLGNCQAHTIHSVLLFERKPKLYDYVCMFLWPRSELIYGQLPCPTMVLLSDILPCSQRT
jgi:hypothetical protein